MDDDLDPLWQDLDWAIGQMLIMGWDGTEVTPQIRELIADHHLGSILLTAKNLKSAEQTATLVRDLQLIARESGHPQPLLIALDQENGGVNSLFDESLICQFPSSMGQAAASSPSPSSTSSDHLNLAYEIAKATATEVSACGVNLILGPVLDVLTNARYQPLGVRATSDDPQEVSQYGIAAIKGYKDAGVATCGKHFPSYGNLDFLGSSLDIPIITQTLEELSLSALVPFRNAIATGKLDAMFVGGCGIANPSMKVAHACLSEQVVDELLREELGFTDGVAISECLEMEALQTEMGVRTGTIMAVQAGCDLVLLCRAYDVQLEAISGLKLGLENEVLTKERIYTSLRRVLKMKKGCTDWAKALNPPGISLLKQIHPSHLALSMKAYDDSITVMRDNEKLLPLNESMHQEEELLLLTPLVKPLPASAMTKTILEGSSAKVKSENPMQDKWIHRERSAIMSGEGVFRELGRSLARARHGKLLHTSYTANGVRPVHESLIQRASTIILLTADANRNLYQAGFTKHVAMMCSLLKASGHKKNLIVVAVSSPYDFAMDKSIGTYICTFDFTETAMSALVRALFGAFTPHGTLPGTLRKAPRKAAQSSTGGKAKTRTQHWLVESYDVERDNKGLKDLLFAMARGSAPNHQYFYAFGPESFSLVSSRASMPTGGDTEHEMMMEEQHFVVRNSSTGALYGFCSTYYLPSTSTGVIGAIFVDPSKRNLSIGYSLHRRAVRNLIQKHPDIKQVQLGCCIPGIFPGIPLDHSDIFSSAITPGSTTSTTPSAASSGLKSWFSTTCGWDVSPSSASSPSTFRTRTRKIFNLLLPSLQAWSSPPDLPTTLQRAGVSFDLIYGRTPSTPTPTPTAEQESVLSFVSSHSSPEILHLYRLALFSSNPTYTWIIRAKIQAAGLEGAAEQLVGSIVISTDLGREYPSLPSSAASGGMEFTGGIIAPVVSSSMSMAGQQNLVLQGLVMLGLRQNKRDNMACCVLSWVSNGSSGDGDMRHGQQNSVETLLDMGFEVQQVWEEVTNGVEQFASLG
ncbi:glycoside hydrolase superfamily [Copromyces sp. CBS 386.78]|nr:glycoside hydrolase superfamily [Copromyces sp. CBS 386.78]